VHSTGVNGVELSSTDVAYRTLTCQNGILAGQRRCLGNFDTEAVAQRASTALNGVEVQVNGVVEEAGFSTLEGERFSVTEVRAAQHENRADGAGLERSQYYRVPLAAPLACA
jgi:hypothetical protein